MNRDRLKRKSLRCCKHMIPLKISFPFFLRMKLEKMNYAGSERIGQLVKNNSNKFVVGQVRGLAQFSTTFLVGFSKGDEVT